MKNYVLKNKKVIIICFVFIVLFVFGLYINDDEKENVENDNYEVNRQVKVTIIGEVKYPNSYYVSEDSTVSDLIELACGLTSNGDTSLLNLNQKLKEGDVIYVRSKSNEVKNKININTANVKELQKLEGITETKACNII